jgi:hypothetical protein
MACRYSEFVTVSSHKLCPVDTHSITSTRTTVSALRILWRKDQVSLFWQPISVFWIVHNNEIICKNSVSKVTFFLEFSII